MGRFDGKVAFVTGAARGQGRSHAVRLAEEGADIIAVDVLDNVSSVPYDLATSDDLEQTIKLVEREGRRIFARQADVREFDVLSSVVAKGVEAFGRLDIVCGNAGVLSFGAAEDITEIQWQQMIDINLTGVWHTAKAAIPHLRRTGGGSIVLTSSTAGLAPYENMAHYVATKHGIVGLMRALAAELAKDKIRVNTVHPTNTDTAMIQNQATYHLFAPDVPPEMRSRDTMASHFGTINKMDVPWVDPVDVSNAVLFLASDEARYVTGTTLQVDAGFSVN